MERTGARRTALPGRTKGMAWAVMVRTYERLHGRAALTEAVARMDEGGRKGLDLSHPTLGILDATWYPETQRNGFFDAIAAPLSSYDQKRLARELARAVMDRSLHGLHRTIFAVMASPERFVKYAQTLWDVHHDTGTLRMRLVSETSLEAAVLEWPSHHRFACMLNHYACVVTLEEMGCREMIEYQTCIEAGAPECVGSYFWHGRKRRL